MDYELNSILNKIKGKFVCVYKEEEKEFNSIEKFLQSTFYKDLKIISISAQNAVIILQLEHKEASLVESNSEWEKEHEIQFGEPPSFF